MGSKKKKKTLFRNQVHLGHDHPHNDEVIPYLEEYGNLPFKLMPFQEEVVKTFCDHQEAGIFADVGTGKTVMSIAIQKWKRHVYGSKALVIMPPILLHQWAASLRKCGETSITIYAGTPKQREALDLDVDWILVGMEIFKKDFVKLYEFLEPYPLTIIVDEAVSIKNPDTENHRSLRDLAYNDIINAKARRKFKDKKAEVKKKAANLSAEAAGKKKQLLARLGKKV